MSEESLKRKLNGDETENSNERPTKKFNKQSRDQEMYGLSGLLYTYDQGKDGQAFKDMMNILSQYPLTLESKQSNDTTPKKQQNEDEVFDISKLLEQEIASVKEQSKISNRAYWKYDVKCKNIAFIGFKENAGVDVIELTSRIFDSFEKEKKISSKAVSRIIPIMKSCHLKNFMEELKTLIDKCFPSTPTTYRLEFRARNNNSISRSEYMKAILPLIDTKHKPDLENPNLIILVEIMVNFCTFSIVSDFNKYKKYNLRNIAGLPQINIPKKQTESNNNCNNTTTTTTTTISDKITDKEKEN
ncbi:hypothetical protein DLAC_03014 [Tieghemostelium lacteum]|uniref:THUMP domain-containing protein n=1 Tax=Tieghemostelium lacteum TaxID=361077 RepID=A0A152A403_TIELA|nr:hypothetical protein DLAC_03014 [Tieghemostelium lacteum]|eukprot:KYR00949.1 hypothetical protein DLAC_03014 [Tieghemostelium lacteum]